MGCYKIGSECCNNCVHWDCHTERKFRGNPPTEVYTDSNCDKCMLTGRGTLSKNTCGMFKHIGGITRTFSVKNQSGACDNVSNILDSLDEGVRTYIQATIDYKREMMRTQEGLQNTQKQERERAQEAKRAATDEQLVDNGMDPEADELSRHWFLMTFKDARRGILSAQLELGKAFYNNKRGVIGSDAEAVKWFRCAAENGDDENPYLDEAQYMLGECYYFGHGLSEDEDVAIIWYEKAAHLGNVKAMRRLAKMYQTEEHQDYDRAFKWAKVGADKEDNECRFSLGLCYYFGRGISEDNDAAFEQFKMAAYGDVSGAGLFLATCYSKGYGTDINFSDAYKWYDWAAAKGNARAQFYLGKLFYFGRYGKKNCKSATKWLLKAAADGEEDAYELLGDLFVHSPVYLTDDRSDDEQALKWNKKAVEHESALAQFNLGLMYYEGKGVRQDYAKAVSLFDKSVENGCDRAYVYLGTCYREGLGVEENLEKAFNFYLRAAEALDRDAMFWCGDFRENGKGCQIDYGAALQWYKKAAAWGDSDAMYSIGMLYLSGKGVCQDLAEALIWCEKARKKGLDIADDAIKTIVQRIMSASDSGDPAGQNMYGKALLNGVGIEKNEAEAVRMFKLASEGGCVDAMDNLGNCYASGRGVETSQSMAFSMYMKAATLGLPWAQLHVARCYLNGRGVDKDRVEALNWYRKAADQGAKDAQNMVGRCYEEGWGTDKDVESAIEWYKLAAANGNVVSMENMAYLYRKGRKVAKDYDQARRWLRIAAESGSADALVNLAEMCLNGEGDEKDFALAFDWLVRGAEYERAECEIAIAYQYRYYCLHDVSLKEAKAVVAEWYERAIEHGSVKAMRLLGDFFKGNSWGSPEDPDKAFEWLTKAAEKGDPEGMYLLGECYEKGIGCFQSESLAEEWKKKGCAAGYDPNSGW